MATIPEIWVPANKALSIVARELGGEHLAALAICERARARLLVATAELLILDETRSSDALVPAEFWWAEGREALEQDWARGDFSTWIDRDVEARAFGVQFDFESLRKLLSPENVAMVLRELSVRSDPAWISASQARRFMYETVGTPPVTAGPRLVDECRLGFVPARAQLMQKRTSANSTNWIAEEREWDVPEWFWMNFTQTGSSSQDWDRGVFKGNGHAPTGRCHIQLTGVYFLKSALDGLLSQPVSPQLPPPEQNKGGRPRKDWWDDLWCAVWGLAYRGDLKPKNQADIEKAMMAWIEQRGETASESTVKPLARKMFVEMQREGQ
jgi:hypothetical protein